VPGACTQDLVGKDSILVVGRVFRSTLQKEGFYSNNDTPEFHYDQTYENNEKWRPASMSREAEINALRKSGVRLNAKFKELPDSFQRATKYLTSVISRRASATLGKVKFRRLTFDQVLLKLHWDSSPGWYWTNLGYKTKGDVIADPKMQQYLRDVYDEKVDLDAAFTGSLKTELRPESRVEENKTRLFQIAPIEHHILLYKYFGQFLDWFLTAFPELVPLQSPFEGNWDEMIRDAKVHPNAYGLDGSSYDYWVNEQFYQLALGLLKAFNDTSPLVDKFFDRTPFALFIDSLGNVIMTPGTNKSGWLLTLFLNTVVTLVSWIALWISVCGDTLDSMHLFEAHVKLKAIGDDNLTSVSNEVVSWYNQANYIEFMDGIMPFEPSYPTAMPADQVTFLSKRTAFDEVYQKYVPTWAFARVYSTALWDKIPKGGNGLFDRLMKLLNLRLLSFYDKQAYKQLDKYCLDLLHDLWPRFRGTADYKTIYDMYWTEDEIRQFFCVPQPMRSLRLYVTNEFFELDSVLASHHNVVETNVAEHHRAHSAPIFEDKPQVYTWGRKIVTRALPFQASTFQTGLLSPVLPRSPTHRTDRLRFQHFVMPGPSAPRKVELVVDPRSRNPSGARQRSAKPAAKVVVVEKAPKPKRAVQFGPRIGGAVKARIQLANNTGRVRNKASAKAGGFNKVGAELANAILNPLSGNPQRNPSFSIRPTGVAKLHLPDDLVFGDGTGKLNRKDHFVAVFRDPRRFAVVYQGRVGATTVYQWKFPAADNTYSTQIDQPIAEGEWANPVAADYVSGEQLHLLRQYAGMSDDGTTGVWVDSSTTGGVVAIQMTGLIPATNYTFTLLKTRDGNSENISYNVAADANGFWTYSIPNGGDGYYNIGPQTPIPAGAQVYTIYNVGSSCFRQLSAPDFEKHALDCNSLHVSAADILLTNTSDDQYKNGMAYGVQVSGDREWTTYVPKLQVVNGSTISSTFAKMVECTSMQAKNGIHGPLLPTDATDYNPIDLGGVVTSNSCVSPFLFADAKDYIIAVLNVGDSSFNGQNFHMTLSLHLEFQTESQWIELACCPYSVETMDKILFSFRSLAVWTANENHISKIFGWIKKKFLPTASRAAMMVAPAFGPYGPAIMQAGRLGETLSQL